MRDRQSVGDELVWIDFHLVLTYVAANAGHFRYAGDGLEFVAEMPILK